MKKIQNILATLLTGFFAPLFISCGDFLEEYSQGWSLDRLAILDRLLLYIALTELQYKPDVPVKVVINEAVEIANKFSTENSSRFINGILNQFARSKGMLASDNQEERSK